MVAKAASASMGKLPHRQIKWITGEEHKPRQAAKDWYDAIMVGIGTVLADDPPSQPVYLMEVDVIRADCSDSKARILNARVLTQESAAPKIIAVTSQASPEKPLNCVVKWCSGAGC